MAADDATALLVRIEASQAKFERQMAAIAKKGVEGATEIENRYQKANDNIAKGFDRGAKSATASLGQQRAAVANLSFQLNDIAMGLASGTSPFTIMVQQGSQVSQALQGAGGGLIGAVKALGGAFATMVNPVSLASYAIIGLGGAAVQYFMSLRKDVPDTNELLKAHAELIRSFDAAFGIAEKGAKQYSDTLKKVEIQKLKDEFGSLSDAVKSAGKDLEQSVLSVPASQFDGATKSIADMNRALQLLEKDVPDFAGFAVAMTAIESSDAPASVKDLARQFRLSAQESIPLQNAVEQTDQRLRSVQISGEQVRKTFEALTAAALGWGEGGASAIDTVVDKVKSGLIPAMTTASNQLVEWLKNFSTLQNQIAQTNLGQIPSVFSGGGKFLNEDELNTFRAQEGQLQAAGQSMAAAMIRGFESFTAQAYPDTRSSTGKFDAWRAGFGSDTVTRSNGQIDKVTRSTIVSLEDAQRDLSRRIIEFQSGIQKAIGSDTWRSLSEAQQAALTSISYNYGSLPKEIVKAINGGGGPEMVAKAIAGLSANPNRRRQEAQSYLSGTGYSLGDAGISKRNPETIFAGSVAQVEKRIAAMNAEYEAQAKLNPLVKDYGFAVDQARIKAQLLADAQRAGLKVTPELAQQIDQLAANYASASAASEKLAETQKQVAQASEFFRDTAGQAFMDLIPVINTGNAALDRLLNTLVEAVAQAALLGKGPLAGLFGGAGSGGLLGGLFGLFGFATGGVARNGRPQPLKTFANGGVSKTAAIFGETGRAEAAVPLPDGRRIPVDLRAPALPQRGNGSTDVVRVMLQDDSGRMADIADQQIRTRSGTIVQVAVQQSTKAVRGQMPGFISEAQARNS